MKDELRRIIQLAWCSGGDDDAADTFGAFLDRAAAGIIAAGYQKGKELPEAAHRPLKELWNTWPGDETIEELLSALKEGKEG